MKFHKFLIFSFITLSLVLSACTAAIPAVAVTAKPTEAMAHDTPTVDAMMHDTATPDAMMHDTATPDAMMHDTATPDAMMHSPAWIGVSLTNVTDGKTFSIQDFKGKVVLVEQMAQWCSTCKAQQKEVKSLLEKLGMPANLVTVSLDIDPNENAETLKAYSASNAFGWIFTVSPADVSREIGNLYGSQFLNPPSAPILVIDSHGAAHPLAFGLKSVDELMKALEPFLKEAM